MNTTTRRYAHVLATAVILSYAPTAVFAAEPTIRALDIRGLKIAGTTTLTIDGDDLGKSPRLLLPFPAKQTLKPGNTDKKAVFDVTLEANVEPGYHHQRVVADGGVSLPAVIGVDLLRQQLVTEPIKELPVALHGTAAGANIIEGKFLGKAKQKIMVEVESQRLGGKLRPIVHLYNPKKLQVAWAWGTPALHGDCRLEAILPDDGEYTVTLHDAEYAAPALSFFRLKIGAWLQADQLFPSFIARNQAARVTAENFTEDVKPANTTGTLALTFPKAGVWSGPRPFVTVSPHAEFVEQPEKDKLQEIPAGAAGISGKLLAPYEEDLYRVAVTPGRKVRLEVFAERIGSPIDIALVVRNDKGDQLARAEDSPGTLDPVLEYTVPDKVTAIVVGVVDAQARGGPRGIYRLVIDPQLTMKDGFKLTTTAPQISLPVGGRAVVPVLVDRRGGYLGKIDLALAPQLPGVKLDGTAIPEGADGSLITLERTGAPFEALVTSWRGKSDDGNEQPVTIKNHPLEKLQPWLATEIAFAPSNQAASDFAVDWNTLPVSAGLVPAVKLALPIKVTRPASKNTVKLTLLTSQNTPLLNNQPDPNKALRQEKPIELAATVNVGEVVALVPVDLSASVYDVTVQAELLDAAKKPIAIAFAPVRRLAVKIPIVVKLDGPTRIETSFDAKKGAALKLQGKIERLEGVKADVTLALTGLPAGAKADAVTVKATDAAFTINVAFPPNIPPGEIKGVKLAGSYAPDSKLANVRVRSREVDITLVLKAPAK
ncbi:MAG: hypothetical protein EXR98_04755 [Gemmataceae bacterium]|nr:hypothetical protein [Gemmataceae bacterium]